MRKNLIRAFYRNLTGLSDQELDQAFTVEYFLTRSKFRAMWNMLKWNKEVIQGMAATFKF
jgi:hypothetical protein